MPELYRDKVYSALNDYLAEHYKGKTIQDISWTTDQYAAQLLYKFIAKYPSVSWDIMHDIIGVTQDCIQSLRIRAYRTKAHFSSRKKRK